MPQLDRAGNEPATVVEVEAVGIEGGRSSVAGTSVSWTGGPVPGNLALSKPATADSACAATEGAAKAVNGSVSGGNADKWCSLGSTRWWQVDLGSARNLNRFVIKHAGAGGEQAAWNTRAYTIQVRSATTEAWRTVVAVTANTASESAHSVAATARYVRLTVTTPTQNGDPAARIYEFEAWGT